MGYMHFQRHGIDCCAVLFKLALLGRKICKAVAWLSVHHDEGLQTKKIFVIRLLMTSRTS